MYLAIPQKIAFLCAIIPIVSVHTTWIIAASMDNLPWCLPYWHSCHSISATGRQYPEFFVFKGIMLPVATLMLAYWFLLVHWLKKLKTGKALRHFLLVMGVLASLALILYTVTLGSGGGFYGLARRIGIVLFFIFTSFAHLILLNGLIREKKSNRLASLTPWLTRMTWICAALVFGSAINGLLGFLWPYWDAWENAFEWTYSLFMMSLFFMVGKMWEATQFTLKFDIDVADKDVNRPTQEG